MEKRIFVAILISIGFLWLWAAVAPKLFPELAKKPEPREAGRSRARSRPRGGDTNRAGFARRADSSAEPETTPFGEREEGTPPAAAEATPVAAERTEESSIDKPDYTGDVQQSRSAS